MTTKRKWHDENNCKSLFVKRACSFTAYEDSFQLRRSSRARDFQGAKIVRKYRQPLPSPSASTAPPDTNLEPHSLSYLLSKPDEHQIRLCQKQESGDGVNTNFPERSDLDCNDPLAHWVLTASWPSSLAQPGPIMSETPSSKRKSSSSHRSGVLERLARNGVLMESSNAISRSSVELCKEFLSGDHKVVSNSVFNARQFDRVLDRVRSLNEARIQRDVTPWIVPSAETLFFRGELQADWIGEELDAEWTRCMTLGSSTPKPDYAAGLLRGAFEGEEIAKLDYYASPGRPVHVTPELCFPFLMCEAKTGERGLNEADRQNMHSASIAVRAIIVLYQEAFGKTEPNRVQHLFGQVLVFTVSHDNDRVFLYGHYAVGNSLSTEGLKFYRYPIALFSLSTRDGEDRLKAYNFVRNVYESFAPDHRVRIKDAVHQLPAPPQTDESLTTSELTLAAAGLQPENHGESFYDDTSFKLPDEPSSVVQGKEVARLQGQIEQQRQQSQQSQQQIADLLRQMDQQRQDSQRQLEQQRQQMEQQRQQMEQQRQQLERQLEQQGEIITLLKATKR